MGNIYQNRLGDSHDIQIFIKGDNHYYGYIIMCNQSPVMIKISESALDVNSSEFVALIKALKDLKNKHLYSGERVKVYCSCKNVACVANFERNPELLSSQFEAFKDLSQGLPLQVNWVPESGDGMEAGNLSELETIVANDRLNSLSQQIAEYKENHHH